ncbi:adipokinetic hormone 3 [Bombyx mori]|uniref:Adipokinetic hormone-3 n=1 Tax=Bombyx mori TaxID=7091 RepID=B3XXJ7_BOMMO|nr:adipokinetic hormone 3 [Bombyx mori]BAG66281.1 adipokinetic hormone-3 [Bombyx mori]
MMKVKIFRPYFSSFFVWAACALAAVAAQITFSRDWSGGKRSVAEAPVDCRQFTRFCRHFVVSMQPHHSICSSGPRTQLGSR